MTSDQIGGIVRTVAAALGGWLVNKGYATQDTLNWIVGAIAMLGTAGWSVWTNRPSKVSR